MIAKCSAKASDHDMKFVKKSMVLRTGSYYIDMFVIHSLVLMGLILSMLIMLNTWAFICAMLNALKLRIVSR